MKVFMSTHLYEIEFNSKSEIRNWWSSDRYGWMLSLPLPLMEVFTRDSFVIVLHHINKDEILVDWPHARESSRRISKDLEGSWRILLTFLGGNRFLGDWKRRLAVSARRWRWRYAVARPPARWLCAPLPARKTAITRPAGRFFFLFCFDFLISFMLLH